MNRTPATRLRIEVWLQDGPEPDRVFVFQADTDGPLNGPGHGSECSVPEPDRAWAALRRHAEKVFFPQFEVPGERLALDVYSGPERAHIQGSYQGRPVDCWLQRTDSLQESRWQALAPLLGGAGS